ncbi:MAG TPA: tRNA (adenosine(37)-N6)-threonylcarbamoyltransferase complex dimerization subunit type 1 TsaB [Verrucomicrobiae bacterium]
MKILALEFSSTRRSVAVFDTASAKVLAETAESGGERMKPLGMIATVLRESAIARKEIECITVGLGPGSYTGIRIAISIAQGWQLAFASVQLLGLSSVDCLAQVARAAGIRGDVLAVVDAQRNEFYAAEYKLDDAGETCIKALALISADALNAMAKNFILIGPEASKFAPNGQEIFPEATALARLAAGRTDYLPGEKLEPIYLRATSFVKAPPPRISMG